MKTKILIFLISSFLLFSSKSFAATDKNEQEAGGVKNSTVTVVCSPELESLVSDWVAGYNEKYGGQEVTYCCRADKISEGTIYFYSSSNPLPGSLGVANKIIVGHDILVPVISAESPLLALLEEEGMTAACFSKLLAGSTTWESIKKSAGDVPLKVYMLNYGQMDAKLADFCDIDNSNVAAVKINDADELISLVRFDKNAIGFCRLSDVVNPDNGEFAGGIVIVPIDKNQNGKIDGFENIYSSPATLSRGAWIGKYPRELCSEVYAAATTLPMDKASNEFLLWVVDEGQETLAASGLSHLTTREKTAGILALNPEQPSVFTPGATGNPNIWITVAAALIIITLVYFVVKAGMKRRSGIQSEDIALTPALNVDSVKAPAGLFYDKTHTWAFMEQNGNVKIGVNDFLPHVTGRLSQIKMKAPGDKIRKGEKILTLVREGKHLDIYSPVTGQIKVQNDALQNNPSQLNADPYALGWVYQVEPANWMREMKFMFMAESFKEWLEDEFARLKDFLAASANSNAVVYNHLVLQDGGELTDSVLADMEPEVWEDFQTNFIDASR